MSYHDILVAQQGAVCTITLNRPDKLNAWTGRMADELRLALEAAAADNTVRAVVITGAGRGFCAGADMSILQAGVAGELPSDAAEAAQAPAASGSVAEGIDHNFAQRFSYMLRLPKPILAAINGPVAGIGLCMTMFCDFRYMAEGQKLTTAFAKRGLIAEHGIAWMLPRLIGPMNALDLLCSARPVGTAEAAAMGLVKALPAEGFLAAVQAVAAELASTVSPRSVGVIKQQVYDSLFLDLSASWRQADAAMLASFGSADFKEGVAHFVEKRAPAFTGQ